MKGWLNGWMNEWMNGWILDNFIGKAPCTCGERNINIYILHKWIHVGIAAKEIIQQLNSEQLTTLQETHPAAARLFPVRPPPMYL